MIEKANFSIEAPAKTNLSLRVEGKRADGFHEIETKMCRLSLVDRIDFAYRSEGSGVAFTCDDSSLPTDDRNLVIKALRAMEAYCHRGFDVDLHLHKRIPSGAGLGGGSSDAAAVLKGLNHLFDLRLRAEQLADISAGIGSDVPYFCYDSTAVCSGRGEIVEPVEFQWKLPMLVIQPPFEIAAEFAYRHWQSSRVQPGVSQLPQICPWGTMENDLERPVFEKYLLLGRLKMWLLGQSEVHAALLSGSGSCMVAVLRRNDSGALLEGRIREAFGNTFACHICHTLPS